MLISDSNSIYDEYNIEPNNLLKLNRKVKPNPVNYINSSTDRQSRYAKSRKLISDNRIFYETYKKYGVIESTKDFYYAVQVSDKNRLDIIANNFYNDASYWWVLALVNNIIDPFKVEVNTVLRIPPIISLYLGGSILS